MTDVSSRPTFTAHNLKLDDGSYTISADAPTIAQHPWFLGAQRALSACASGQETPLSLVDLGCLEGGYAVEFARLGFDVCGVEVRTSNFEACEYVRERVDLPNLRFVQDDVWNLAQHGQFDVVFCSGLLYHLDRPAEFLRMLGQQTNRMLILQTHFAPNQDVVTGPEPEGVRNRLKSAFKEKKVRLGLSPLTENEGLPGRWFPEDGDRDDLSRWASWGNATSFWLTRPALLQVLKDAGFDLVLEQYDNLEPSIFDSLNGGYYAKDYRSTFLGVKL